MKKKKNKKEFPKKEIKFAGDNITNNRSNAAVFEINSVTEANRDFGVTFKNFQ